MDEIEKKVFATDEECIAFMEEQHAKIAATRIRPNKKIRKDPGPYDADEDFLRQKPEVESLYEDNWFLDKENLDLFEQQIGESIGRYPRGFRHLENFANYNLVKPESKIADYVQEMNRQIEFEEFLTLMRGAAQEEANSVDFKFDANMAEDRGDPTIDEMLMSDIFVVEARAKFD